MRTIPQLVLFSRLTCQRELRRQGIHRPRRHFLLESKATHEDSSVNYVGASRKQLSDVRLNRGFIF